MKNKRKNIKKSRKQSSCSGVKIQIVLTIIVIAVGLVGAWLNTFNLFDAGSEMFSAALSCLQRKADHVIDIAVVLIIVLIKSIISRYKD